MPKDKVAETVAVPFKKAEQGLKLKPGHKTVVVLTDKTKKKPPAKK